MNDMMQVDVKNLISMTEANQNFSKVARLVDEKGSAVILKNNMPRYVVVDYRIIEKEATADSETIQQVSEKLLKKYADAFRELAK